MGDTRLVAIPSGFWGLAGVSGLWRNYAVCGLKKTNYAVFYLKKKLFFHEHDIGEFSVFLKHLLCVKLLGSSTFNSDARVDACGFLHSIRMFRCAWLRTFD